MRTELVNTEDQDGLVDLESQDLGLDEGKRLSVNLDETLSGLNNQSKHRVQFSRVRSVGSACVPCSGRQLLVMMLAMCDSFKTLHGAQGECHRTSRSLLLAEALHTLGGHFGRLWDVRAVSTGWASVLRSSWS